MVNSADEKERSCGDSKNLDPSFVMITILNMSMTEQVYEPPLNSTPPLPLSFKVLLAEEKRRTFILDTAQNHGNTFSRLMSVSATSLKNRDLSS